MIFGSAATQALRMAVKSIGTSCVLTPTASQYPEITCRKSGSQPNWATEKMLIVGSLNLPG